MKIDRFKQARQTSHRLFAHCNGHPDHDGGHVTECQEMTLVIAEKLQSMTYRDSVNAENRALREIVTNLCTMLYMHYNANDIESPFLGHPAHMAALRFIEKSQTE